VSNRLPKVNELVKRELAQLILKEVEFPKDIFVTITRAETSGNLIDVKIYISVIPEGAEAKVMAVLNRHIYEIQQKFNKRVKMRPVPKIRFVEEKKTREASRIEQVLEGLKKEEK
jgi:ribosome-binding factor A